MTCATHVTELRHVTRLASLAFTLAEVLIVLGILGLIADMTIPTLVSSTEEKVAVTRLKSTYSILENAFRLAVSQNGTPDTWGSGEKVSAQDVLDAFLPNIKTIQLCGSENSQNCMSNGPKNLAGQQGSIDYSADYWRTLILANGASVAFQGDYERSCKYLSNDGNSLALKNVCTNFHIDINGPKKPNQWGKDYFILNLTKYGLIPMGTELQTNGSYSFNGGCNKDTGAGIACAAWVIYNENMDYLHCRDLSWSGKKTCK